MKRKIFASIRLPSVMVFWMELVESSIKKRIWSLICVSLLLLNALMSWEERAVSSTDLMKRKIFASIRLLSVMVFWMELVESSINKRIWNLICASLLLLNALMFWEECAVSSTDLMKWKIFAYIQLLSVKVSWMEPVDNSTELKIKSLIT